MRVAIQTLGTRGDVQPYLALARGLTERGHRVQIAAPVQFDDMVRARSVDFAPLPGEFLELLDSADGKAAIAGGQGFGAGLKLLKHVRPLMRRLLDAEWAAASTFAPDVIVHHPKSLASPHMAEALSCPAVLASPLPGFTPTSAFPSPILPFATLGPLNRASHALSMKAGEFLFGRMIRHWRETTLRLTGHRSNPDATSGTLYAYSRHVVPIPREWGRDVLVSGYWFLDGGTWQPPEDLAAFLDAGDPPIYVGFGSVPGLDAERITAMVIEALARTKKRGLLATGGGALKMEGAPTSVHVIREAPHDWLLPRVSAAIHHGGAGTTAAVLRAGRSAVICPFFGDQLFWGRRIAALGAGPPALPLKSLSVGRFAEAIAETDDPLMRRRAAELGEAIRREDGVTAAVKFIEEVVAKRSPRAARSEGPSH